MQPKKKNQSMTLSINSDDPFAKIFNLTDEGITQLMQNKISRTQSTDAKLRLNSDLNVVENKKRVKFESEMNFNTFTMNQLDANGNVKYFPDFDGTFDSKQIRHPTLDSDEDQNSS